MLYQMTKRMLTETDPRLLWRFSYNFGYKGMRSVQRYKKRLKRGEHFPPFLFISILNSCQLRCQGCWVDVEAESRKILGRLERGAITPEDVIVGAQVNRVAVIDGHTECISLRLAREALAMRRSLMGPGHPLVAHNLRGLGTLLSKQGDHAEAIERLQAVKQENDVLKAENGELSSQLSALEQEKSELSARLDGLQQQLQSAEAGSANLDALKGRVDGILSKFELLDL